MTTYLGVSPSDVCEWDTKPSATDPTGQEVLGVGSADRSARAGAEGGYEPSVQGLGRRLRRNRGPGMCREEMTWKLEKASQPNRRRWPSDDFVVDIEEGTE
jgi:hypothetical protein